MSEHKTHESSRLLSTSSAQSSMPTATSANGQNAAGWNNAAASRMSRLSPRVKEHVVSIYKISKAADESV